MIWAGVVAPYADLFERWRAAQGCGPPARPRPDPDRDSPPLAGRGWLETYGAPEENPEFWASISPSSYLGDLSGPIQLHHGTADDSVPVEFSEELYAQLPGRAAARASELYTYAGDNHNISNSFGTAMQRSVEFFDQHVKGVNGE